MNKFMKRCIVGLVFVIYSSCGIVHCTEFTSDLPLSSVTPQVEDGLYIYDVNITKEFVNSILETDKQITNWNEPQKRIRIIDVEREENPQFARKVLEALHRVAQTKVGQRLIYDIFSVDVNVGQQPENELIIMQRDLAQILSSKYTLTYDNIDEAMTNFNLPKVLSKLKNIEDDDNIKDFLIIEYLDIGPQLMPRNFSTSNYFNRNIVFLNRKSGDYVHLTESMNHKQPTYGLNPEVLDSNDDASFDIFVFHELNHYRHYLQRKNTMDFRANSMRKFPGGMRNTSSSNIMQGHEKIQASMYNYEEELQLTGKTVIDHNVMEDPVNETAYRIQRQPDDNIIRFPYVLEKKPSMKIEASCLQGALFIDSMKNISTIDLQSVLDYYKRLKVFKLPK